MELYNEAEVALTEEWLDLAHDAGLAGDRDWVSNLKGLFLAEASGRDQLVAAAQLVAVVAHPGHVSSKEASG